MGEQIAQENAVFVRGIGGAGGDPPVFHHALSVEKGCFDVGVANVQGENHGSASQWSLRPREEGSIPAGERAPAKVIVQFRPLIRRRAIKMGVHSTAAAMASQVPAISAVPPIRLSTEAVSMPHNT